MAYVLIALGSNIRQAAHITWAAQRLSALIQDLHVSRKLWTPDHRGTGLFYMNLLVSGSTTLTVSELEATLKGIESSCGRSKEHVTIDLDLMQYDDERHHLKDWPRPYIQQLLPDLQ